MGGPARERKWPLVLFTLLVQAAAGLTWVLAWARFLAPDVMEPAAAPGFVVVLGMLGLGVAAAVLHLGQVGAARLSLSNLRSSWLSREVGLVALFGAAVLIRVGTGQPAWGLVAAGIGLGLVFAIARIYMIRTVPAWNHWTTPVSFSATALLLGMAAFPWMAALRVESLEVPYPLAERLALGIGVGMVFPAALQILTALVHARRFGSPAPWLVAVRVGTVALGAACIYFLVWRDWLPGHSAVVPLVLASVLFLVSELLGRYLFYASHRRIGL